MKSKALLQVCKYYNSTWKNHIIKSHHELLYETEEKITSENNILIDWKS